MTPAMLDQIAARFKALGEPTRLQLLQALRGGERHVGELIEETGLGQANVSKHLRVLYAAGLISRRRKGLYVYYGLADADVLQLCDLMCNRVQSAIRSLGRRLDRR